MLDQIGGSSVDLTKSILQALNSYRIGEVFLAPSGNQSLPPSMCASDGNRLEASYVHSAVVTAAHVCAAWAERKGSVECVETSCDPAALQHEVTRRTGFGNQHIHEPLRSQEGHLGLHPL